MAVPVSITVHESAFPGALRRRLIEGLRARVAPPSSHYQTPKQTQRWLAVHQAHSPAHSDADCKRIYDEAFAGVAAKPGPYAHVIGLGCGGSQKEARLLRVLAGNGASIVYSPCDASLPLLLDSRELTAETVGNAVCHPLLCDVTEAADLPRVLDDFGMSRIVTFFGLIPNVEPETMLPKLKSLIRRPDILLVSANLAPGPDYASGARAVLPGYDNPETRKWLLTLLDDLGVEPLDGELGFAIEGTDAGHLRIVANYTFGRERVIEVDGERIGFAAGEKLRLFYSYRYTIDRIASLFAGHQMKMVANWQTKSGEEGVFQFGY